MHQMQCFKGSLIGSQDHSPLSLSDDPASSPMIAKLEESMPVEKYTGSVQNLSSIAPHSIGMQLDSFTGSVSYSLGGQIIA